MSQLRDCAIIIWRGGGWEMGKIRLKIKLHPPLTTQKLTLAPPHLLIILRSTPPSPASSPLVPSYLVYVLDVFLRYKKYFKRLFSVRVLCIWRNIKLALIIYYRHYQTTQLVVEDFYRGAQATARDNRNMLRCKSEAIRQWVETLKNKNYCT